MGKDKGTIHRDGTEWQQDHHARERQLLNEARESMNFEFKNIANEIFDNKQKVFTEKSGEQLGSLLKPLSERIKEFEKRVEDSYSRESKERFSLIKEANNLQDLNARII